LFEKFFRQDLHDEQDIAHTNHVHHVNPVKISSYKHANKGAHFGEFTLKLRYNCHMPEPNLTLDTTPESEAVLIKLLRAKPPERRLEEAVSASNRVAE